MATTLASEAATRVLLNCRILRNLDYGEQQTQHSDCQRQTKDSIAETINSIWYGVALKA
jgi:hypothetical protein